MNNVSELVFLQIADFGMSRDLIDDNYYITSGGKIPVRWTAPEVANDHISHLLQHPIAHCRHYITKSTQFRVMYGVMDVYCMKYGVWGVSHMESLIMLR